MSRYWSPIVDRLSPYVPGEQPKIDKLVKLNTNENPYGPSPRVSEAIRGELGDGLRLYPDATSSRRTQTETTRSACGGSRRCLRTGSGDPRRPTGSSREWFKREPAKKDRAAR